MDDHADRSPAPLLSDLDRRSFLKLTAGAAAGLALSQLVSFGAALPVSADTDGQWIALPTGAVLFYEVLGEGRPMLVIHGGLGLDHTYFHPWIDPLADQFQLVLPDLRGNGRSLELPDSEYTHAKMVADLDALRQALGIAKWAVIVHSYGGFLAQQYALQYPETISYLVLLDTNPAPFQLPGPEGAQLASSKLTPEIGAALAKLGTVGSDAEWASVWRTILPLYFYKYDVESLIANDQTRYRSRVLTYTIANELAKFDTRASLNKLTMPTLVAVGRYDWVTPVRGSQVMYKGIPGAELAIFEESGHFPFIEEQARFLRVMKQFLNVVE